MTPGAQRIAIAEACGWTGLFTTTIQQGAKLMGTHPKLELTTVAPDYLSDLNAMHEAEKVLTRTQQFIFCEWLDEIKNEPVVWRRVHATAAQRAEAFLRTIEKWDDKK